MKLLKAGAFGLCGLALSGGAANAAVLLTEDFNYSDGAISSVSAGAWAVHSGTDSGTTALNVTSGVAQINQSDGHASGADVNRALSNSFDPNSDNTSKLYAAFTVNFSALPFNSGTSTAGSYFAHFKSSAANEFYARIGSNQEGAAAGTFRLAISNENWTTASTAEFPQDLSLNTTYTVVVRMDLATDQSTLWVNPASEASTSVTATDAFTYVAGAINAYALRQGTSNSTGAPGNLGIDGLRVGTSFAEVVPEPTGLATLATGGLLVLARRKRR